MVISGYFYVRRIFEKQCTITYLKKESKTLWPLLWMGFNCLRTRGPLKSHYELTVYFRPTSSHEILVLISWILEGWKAESNLEWFHSGTPGLGIQHLNYVLILMLPFMELYLCLSVACKTCVFLDWSLLVDLLF